MIDKQKESNHQSQDEEDFHPGENIFNALEEFKNSDDYDVRISTKDILPNVMISNISSSVDLKDKRSKATKKSKKKSSLTNNLSDKLETKQMDKKKSTRKNHQMGQPSVFEELQQVNRISLPSDPSQVEVLSSQNSENSQEDSEDDESYPQSVAIVESKLNQAMRYIETNKIFELEEFLYNFKTKYLYMTEKVQIKWRLLMAHCKQYRREFERAAFLYDQVIQIAEVSPNLLALDIADIYHRLGLCYTEIRLWNEGIVVLVKALNLYKHKNKRIKYAECMNNLGTLYLNGRNISEAQKCFLISYSVKKQEFSDSSIKLLSCLFNLYECNLIKRNYIQAESIIRIMENIVVGLKDNKMLMGGIFRRKGKLFFMKGDLKKADDQFMKAIELLKNDFAYSLEYGQVLNNYALLKLDASHFTKAKDMFEKSLSILNFYYNRDTVAIQNLKRNLVLAEQNIVKDKAKKKEERSAVFENLFAY